MPLVLPDVDHIDEIDDPDLDQIGSFLHSLLCMGVLIGDVCMWVLVGDVCMGVLVGDVCMGVLVGDLCMGVLVGDVCT